VFVIFESAFSVMTRLKTDTNRMADKTCTPACVCRPRKLKRTLFLLQKNKKQRVVLLFFWCVLHLFSSSKSLFWVANKQTENLQLP